MKTYLPVLVAAAALVLTYLFCIRPMRSGACLPSPGARRDTLGRGRELELARTELELLRSRQRMVAGAAPYGANSDGEGVVRDP